MNIPEGMRPGDIVAALEQDRRGRLFECGFVIHVTYDERHGRRCEPQEVWIPALSVWVRADGRSLSGDCGRGYFYPDIVGRWRIRRAVRKWEAAMLEHKRKERGE